MCNNQENKEHKEENKEKLSHVPANAMHVLFASAEKDPVTGAAVTSEQDMESASNSVKENQK